MADSNLIKYGDYYYLQSKDVKVFPSAYRGSYPTAGSETSTFDPEARLNTEYNYINSTAISGIRGTPKYIVGYETSEKISTQKIKLVIDGYYFELNIKLEDLIVDSKILGFEDIETATILIKDSEGGPDSTRETKALCNLVGSGGDLILDTASGTNWIFTGLRLSINDGAWKIIDSSYNILQKNLKPNIIQGEATDDIKVKGKFSIDDGTEHFSVEADGDTTINGTLTQGSTNPDDQVIFHGNVDAKNGLDITGDTLTVDGDKFIVDNSGNTDIKGTLITAGATTLNNTLNITGKTTINNELEINGNSLSMNRRAGSTIGTKSVAAGKDCSASGETTFATGADTIASGQGAFASGSNTAASHICSHAGGSWTQTGADYQTVIGKYNKGKSDTLFEVGNGTSEAETNRKNAFEVYKDGSAKVGKPIDSETDLTVATKGYVDNKLPHLYHHKLVLSSEAWLNWTVHFTSSVSTGYQELKPFVSDFKAGKIWNISLYRMAILIWYTVLKIVVMSGDTPIFLAYYANTYTSESRTFLTEDFVNFGEWTFSSDTVTTIF